MAGNKTKPTDASVEDDILSRASEQQRTDCHELMALLEKVTRQSPKMWGQASLEQLVAGSVAEVRRRYGSHSGAQPLARADALRCAT